MARPARANASAASLFAVVTILTAEPASALILQPGSSPQHQFRHDRELIDVVERGGAVARRGGATRWVRPAHYHWRPGGAIAAGAAIGFVVAATAAAWAGPPPAPGCCWYYTDPDRTQGFWDVCP